MQTKSGIAYVLLQLLASPMRWAYFLGSVIFFLANVSASSQTFFPFRHENAQESSPDLQEVPSPTYQHDQICKPDGVWNISCCGNKKKPHNFLDKLDGKKSLWGTPSIEWNRPALVKSFAPTGLSVCFL